MCLITERILFSQINRMPQNKYAKNALVNLQSTTQYKTFTFPVSNIYQENTE
jgi:hypothetical protein